MIFPSAFPLLTDISTTEDLDAILKPVFVIMMFCNAYLSTQGLYYDSRTSNRITHDLLDKAKGLILQHVTRPSDDKLILLLHRDCPNYRDCPSETDPIEKLFQYLCADIVLSQYLNGFQARCDIFSLCYAGLLYNLDNMITNLDKQVEYGLSKLERMEEDYKAEETKDPSAIIGNSKLELAETRMKRKRTDEEMDKYENTEKKIRKELERCQSQEGYPTDMPESFKEDIIASLEKRLVTVGRSISATKERLKKLTDAEEALNSRMVDAEEIRNIKLNHISSEIKAFKREVLRKDDSLRIATTYMNTVTAFGEFPTLHEAVENQIRLL